MSSDLLDLRLERFFLVVKEFGEGPPDVEDIGQKHRNTSVRHAISVLRSDRRCEVKYRDKDDPTRWATPDHDTSLRDLTDPPKFYLRFTSPEKVFSSEAFFQRGRFKIFSKLRPTDEEFKLRIPQEEALKKLAKVLKPAAPASRFMAILPTGLGKTSVMALAPFMLEATKVLVILPNLTIGDQIYQQLSNMYSRNHTIGRTGDVKAVVWKYDGNSLVTTADVITTNVQALMDRANSKEGTQDDPVTDDPVTDERKDFALKEQAKHLINQHRPDLVMIDEGHHFPASSWEMISEQARHANQMCKFFLLTATPQRGDGASYGLTKVDRTGEEFFYLYPRKEAIKNKYIKSIKIHPIEPTFKSPKLLQRYEETDYIIQMIDPAVELLNSLRESCGGAPIRMLISARTNKAASDLVTFFNERSKANNWNLQAAAITGMTKATNASTSARFACDANNVHPGGLIDVVVQNQMLGEGYDNPWIAVSVFLRPAKSVGYLSQTHGRAIRKPSLDVRTFVRAMESHLFFPDEVDPRNNKHEVLDPRNNKHEVLEVVKQYMDGEDESIESLFAVAYKTLKAAHTKMGQMSTEEIVVELRNNFHEYHEKYAERREGSGDDGPWKPIPAEEVADILYGTLINDLNNCDVRVIDFGCGLDGLFESKLAENVKARDANGGVLVMALDVVPLLHANALTDAGAMPEDGLDNKHTSFTCKSIACDYTQVTKNPDFRKEGKFDAGVFCLALMANDALGRGLLTAAEVVKPNGAIYIVENTWKLGINPRWGKEVTEQAILKWSAALKKRTGFQVQQHWVRGNPKCVYLQLTNVGLNEMAKLSSKLEGISFKNLMDLQPPDSEPPILTKSSESSDSHAGPSSSGNQQSIERRLSFASEKESKLPRNE